MVANTRVSVIVPVYNTAKWLPRCLHSLVHQTLPGTEIICVDDASTDGSWEILEDYAGRHPSVRLLRNAVNRGVGAARNQGIREARGEYLGFIDSDDFVHWSYYADLYAASEGGSIDIVKGEIWGFNNDTNTVEPRESYAINSRIPNHNAWFCFGFTSAIFKASLIAEHGILFPEGIVTLEDPCFSIMAALRAAKIAVINSAAYFYAFNPHSATTEGPLHTKTEATRIACQLMLDFLEKEGIEPYPCNIVTGFLKEQLNAFLRRKDLTPEDRRGLADLVRRIDATPGFKSPDFPRNVSVRYPKLSQVEKLRMAVRGKNFNAKVRAEAMPASPEA